MREASRVLQTAVIPPPLDQRRRSERRSCSLRVALIARHGTIHARLEDISAGGIGFTAETLLALKPGETLLLTHGALGQVSCVVRWSMHPRYGAEFTQQGKPLVLVNAFYDSLGTGPGGLP